MAICHHSSSEVVCPEGVVKMRTRRIILTSAIIICVLLIFVSINVALIGLTLVLLSTSDQKRLYAAAD